MMITVISLLSGQSAVLALRHFFSLEKSGHDKHIKRELITLLHSDLLRAEALVKETFKKNAEKNSHY